MSTDVSGTGGTIGVATGTGSGTAGAGGGGAAGAGSESSQLLPTRKVTAGGVAGALSVVLVWAANTFWMPEAKQIPAEIASALTTILSFLVSYFVPESTH